jgi:hypothetical protein
MMASNLLVAQSLQHPWSVTDGGGGKSSGGGYTLSHSVGQPVAGTSVGSEYNLESGYIPGLRVITGTTSTLDENLFPAWNLLSVPFIAGDMRKTALYPSAVTNAFTYGPSGYSAKDTLRNGVGYWLKFPSAQTITLSGTSFSPESIDVVTGWNMIGTISYSALTANVVPIGTSIGSLYFAYGIGGYYSEDTMKPGLGYWVKTTGSGRLVVSSAPAIPPSTPSSLVELDREQSPARHSLPGVEKSEEFGSLNVRDAREQDRTVYFSGANKNIDLASFELPPLPPGDVLDVRFKTQRAVAMLDAGTTDVPLQISGAAYPITFSWDVPAVNRGFVLEIRTGRDGVRQYPMSGNGSVVVADEDLISAKIGKVLGLEMELPKEYSLYQNYPNPFNPLTKIRYDLPKASRVSLKVYDMLGQEVLTIVDEQKDAGRYTAEMNANALPSGVYHYRLIARQSESGRAGEFTSVKKLLLVK